MKIKMILVGFFLPLLCWSQEMVKDSFGVKDTDYFTIAVLLPKQTDEIGKYNISYLENKLFSSLAYAGISGIYPDYSFVLFPLLTISDKEVTATNPTLYAITCDMNLYLMDYENSTTYGTFYKQMTGVGKTEQHALKNALKSLNPRDIELQKFLIESKNKVLTYVSKNCDQIIARAKSKSKAGRLVLKERKGNSLFNFSDTPVDGKRQALSMLSSIDESHERCYNDALDLMNSIYEELKNESCESLAIEAKIFASEGYYDAAANKLLQIPIKSKCKDIIDETIKLIKREKKQSEETKDAIKIHTTSVDSIATTDLYKKMAKSHLKERAEKETDHIAKALLSEIDKKGKN